VYLSNTHQASPRRERWNCEAMTERDNAQLCHPLAAARSRLGSDSPPDCHSLPRRRFATHRRRSLFASSLSVGSADTSPGGRGLISDDSLPAGGGFVCMVLGGVDLAVWLRGAHHIVCINGQCIGGYHHRFVWEVFF